MEYFKINDKKSSDFNIYVYSSNLFDSATEDVETVEIPGRNGALHISNNRFNTFNAKLSCYCKNGMQENFTNFKNYLLSLKDTFILTDSAHSDVMRIARLTDPLTLILFNKSKATFDLLLKCRPECFLLSGQSEITITSGDILNNPTMFASKPKIKVTGNGTITINTQTITVNTQQDYVMIDCDMMDCYCETINCNNDVQLSDFPELIPGDNTISYSGFTAVTIIPQWWRL